MAATDRGTKILEFESEAQEARWWDEHKDLVEEHLIEAMRDGTAQRGSAQRTCACAASEGLARIEEHYDSEAPRRP